MERFMNYTFTMPIKENIVDFSHIDCKYLCYYIDTPASILHGFVKFRCLKSYKLAHSLMPFCSLEYCLNPREVVYNIRTRFNFVETSPCPEFHAMSSNGDAGNWKRARTAAMDGDFDAIDDQLFIKYYDTFKKIRADRVSELDISDVSDLDFASLFELPLTN